MFITMDSTHFVSKAISKEENVLFNDALNTFYLRLCASNIWQMTAHIPREETSSRHYMATLAD